MGYSSTGVRKMRLKALLFALLLGVVFPGMILLLAENLPRKDTEKTSQTTEPSITADTPHQPVQEQNTMLPVILADGSRQQMALEDYLVGVVLGEMPADFELEALKAQAVVARTYTIKHHESQQKHDGGALCTDHTCCQAYRAPEDYLADGGTQAQLDKILGAIADTCGQVLYYDGQLIDATYFSCSGGRTEDAAAVWGQDVPYLQAVDSPGEEGAAHFVDSVSFTAAEFFQKLGTAVPDSTENWLGQITYTDGGGVATADIDGRTYNGVELRQLLGLRSTAFVIHPMGDQILITTKGFGHRVGMSQYGADAMAVQGSDYMQILAHYYPGTTLEIPEGNELEN